MKIALVSRYYNKHQGIPHDVAELAERFVRIGHDVHVFTQVWSDVCDERIVFHAVPAIAKRSFINELFFFFLSGIMLRKHRFDVVNYHDPCFHTGGIFTCHAFPEAGIRIIENIGRRENTGINMSFFLPFKMLYPVSNYNMKSKSIEKIISVSQFIKSEIIEHQNKEESDVVVIPNGVDLEMFNPDNRCRFRESIMERHNIADEDFIILFVGYYHLRKGLQFLVRALALIEDERVKIVVVGDDSDAERYIFKLIKQHKLENRIVFAGNQHDVYRYFSIGDTLVFPTLYEPFGNVILEAMACGIVPVLSKLAGAADLIVDGKNGLLINNPIDVSEIAERIRMLVNDRKLLTGLAHEASITAKHYSWDAIADITLGVYWNVVNKRKN